MTVRSILTAFSIVALTLVMAPAVAHATRVAFTRIHSIESDDTAATLMSAEIFRAGGEVPGWVMSMPERDMFDLMAAYHCPEQETPSVDCLVTLANTEGSGVHATIIIFGSMRRLDDDPNPLLRIEVSLFDYEQARIARHLTVELRMSQLMDEAWRARLGTAFVTRLAAPPSDEPVMPDLMPAPATSSEVPAVAGHDLPEAFDLEYVAWPLIGLAVASLGIEIGVWAGLDGLQHDPDFVAYRSSFGSGTGNACNQPADGSMLGMRGHSLCSQGDTLEALEWTFMAVGLGSAAAGITLLLLDLMGENPPGEHALLIRPVIGPTLASLDVGWQF